MRNPCQSPGSRKRCFFLDMLQVGTEETSFANTNRIFTLAGRECLAIDAASCSQIDQKTSAILLKSCSVLLCQTKHADLAGCLDHMQDGLICVAACYIWLFIAVKFHVWRPRDALNGSDRTKCIHRSSRRLWKVTWRSSCLTGRSMLSGGARSR